MSMQLRVTLAALVLLFCLLGLGEAARLLAPASNTSLTRFDAIIVLGNPADDDGNPSPEQLARVTEGVREYERGVAPRLMMTGGATHHQFVEARVMTRSALALGIPESAILVEPEARNTTQNACYAERILQAHGWRSAEVVSSAYHLPRAGLIFSGVPLEWRTHAAPPLEPESAVSLVASAFAEDLKTARYLLWTRWSDRCEP
jgi:uncharacterized SAM-binding protein YcdF (DUF218 family)